MFNFNPDLNYYLNLTVDKARSLSDVELAYAIQLILDFDEGTPSNVLLAGKQALDEDEQARQLFLDYGKKFKSFITSPQLDSNSELSDLLIGDEDESYLKYGHIPDWNSFLDNVSEFIDLFDDFRFKKLQST